MCRLRVGALVVWRGQVVPIARRELRPDGNLYTVSVKLPSRGLITDHQVTLGQLMAELCQRAAWCVGDTITLGPHDRYIQARWWNSRNGRVLYRIGEQPEGGRTVVRDQDELLTKLGQEVGG